MRHPFHKPLALLFTLALAGCYTTNAPNPDYRVQVMEAPSGHGVIAVPPECLSWHENQTGGPTNNNPHPTFGCASARNLAVQIADPNDLIKGKPLGSPDAIVSAAAIARYQAGQTLTLIDPNANKPGTIIKMEDSRLGGASAK